MDHKNIVYAVYSKKTGCRDAHLASCGDPDHALDHAKTLNEIVRFSDKEYFYVRAVDLKDLNLVPGYSRI